MTFSIHFLAIFSRQGITPLRERIAQEMRIVESLVACYLHADEIRFLIGFGLACQLHLCHDQTFIIAIELLTSMVFVPINFITRSLQVSFKMALLPSVSIVALSRVRVLVFGSKYTVPFTPLISVRLSQLLLVTSSPANLMPYVSCAIANADDIIIITSMRNMRIHVLPLGYLSRNRRTT